MSIPNPNAQFVPNKYSTSLRQYRDGHWRARIRWREHGKSKEKSYHLGTNDAAMAEMRFAMVKANIVALLMGLMVLNFQSPKPVQQLTVEQAVEIYLTDYSLDPYKARRDSTIQLNKEHLFLFANAIGPQTSLVALNQSSYEKFITRRIQKGLSPSYVNITIRVLRAWWTWLRIKYPWISEIEFRKLQEPYKCRYFSENQFNLILMNTASAFLRAVFTVYLETGARRSELLNGIIDGLFLVVPSQKSKSGRERIIQLKSEHVPIIKKMQSLPHKPEYYSRKLSEARKKANLTEGSLHWFRSSFAIRTLLRTNNLNRVAISLGHSSVSTSEIYTRFDIRKLRQDFPSILNNNKRNNSK